MKQLFYHTAGTSWHAYHKQQSENEAVGPDMSPVPAACSSCASAWGNSR